MGQKQKTHIFLLYDDFIRLFFLHSNREASVLENEFPEESVQFPFLRDSCFANLKGDVDLIMVKGSDIRVRENKTLTNEVVKFHIVIEE